MDDSEKNKGSTTVEERHVITTRYYYAGSEIAMDFCFDFTGLFLGATGAVGTGFYTGFFNTVPPSLLDSAPPQVTKLATGYPKAHEKIKQVNSAMSGGPLAWRISKRAALGSLLYCFLECKMQGHRYYRSVFDCALAGALSGAIFGARGGIPAAGYSAAGFSAYAVVSHFLYH